MIRLFANAAHSQASLTALSLEYSLGFLFSYLPLWLLTSIILYYLEKSLPIFGLLWWLRH